jgi:cytochrome c oxidase subunit 2
VRFLSLVVLGTVIGAIVSVFLIVLRTLPQQASEQAGSIDGLYIYMLGFSGIIFGIVILFMLYSAIKFRARPGDTREGPPEHGNTRLEIVWTVIPFLIVVSCGVAGWWVLDRDDVTAEARAGGQEIRVIGYQYGWKYDYPAHDLVDQDELVLPVDEPTAIDLNSLDVIHSWWVPDWRIQMNATPGQTNYTSVTPTVTGSFAVVCTYLCGAGHTSMNSEVEGSIIPRVRVVTKPEFEQWIAERQAEAAAEATTTAEAA